MLQLGDLQLLLRGQRLVLCFRAGDRKLGGNFQTFRALSCQRLFQGGNVIRKASQSHSCNAVNHRLDALGLQHRRTRHQATNKYEKEQSLRGP